MKNKKIMFIIVTSIIILLVTIFLIFYYKNKKNGNNNINKSEEELINDILNIKTYNAKLDITIETNKNKTSYVIIQKLEEGRAYQEVIEPQNIAGITTEYNGTDLKITNNKLDLETTFQNYQYMVENRLWLDAFLEEYKKGNSSKCETDQNEIILEVKRNDNPYNVVKKLYIDKNTGKPTKMTVSDINQKTIVYILYTEIQVQ